MQFISAYLSRILVSVMKLIAGARVPTERIQLRRVDRSDATKFDFRISISPVDRWNFRLYTRLVALNNRVIAQVRQADSGWLVE